MWASPHRSPGSRLPAGKTPSTATCTQTAPTRSTSTRARRSSRPAGPDPMDETQAARLKGPPTVAGDAGHFLELFRTMVLIRRFEETVHDLFLRGEIYGSTHLCIGQEAVAAGVASVLGENDLVAATYRGHGHALALGTDPQELLDELTGRRTGICGGRAGSMNVVDREHRLIGCFGIVGGSLGAATGSALALRRVGGVAVALFGDGAVNQAYFHECLNF